MTVITPRTYQREAIDSIPAWFEERSDNPLLVLPTAAGKSLVVAEFCREVVTQWPDQRIAVVTHVRELVGQNYEELLTVWPDAPAGVYSAGHGRRDKNKSITFCSIQTVYNKIHELQWLNLIIVDECHLIPHKGQGMYRTFIDKMTKINPNLKVIGLSATPYRMNGGWLHKGEGALFGGIAYEKSVLELVDEGYLTRLVAKDTNTKLDVTGVQKSGGEFVGSQLQKAIDLPEITREAVKELVYWGRDRKSWIVFGAGTDHCNHIRDEIRSHGISAECVLQGTPKAERKNIIEGHKSQKIKCLVSRFIASTGYNAKAIDLIGDMAPTESAALYVQKYGRGMRLFPGKSSCLVLDFAKNVERHGPIDQVKPRQPRERAPDEETEAPVKVCPECATFLPIWVPECPECGFQFPPPAPKIEQTASMLSPMTTADPDWVEIDDVSYAEHIKKATGKRMLKVQYRAGLKWFPQYVLLEHEGPARRRAENWWVKYAKTAPPSSVHEALQRKDELFKPSEIAVLKSGKFWDIVDAR